MATQTRIAALAVVLLMVLIVAAPTHTASASGGIHCVRPGETLYSIAAYYGVSPYALATYNGLANPNYIQAGWCLKIPPAGSATYPCGAKPCQPKPVTYPCGPKPCQPKPVTYPCGARPCQPKPVTYPCGARPCQPKPVVQPCQPPACGGYPSCGPLYNGYYTVRPGDTLFAIGRCFGVSPWAIASANHLPNPNCIRAGQVLYIPR